MSEELCLPVTTQPRVRVYRCGHCREEGHNRATCPGLADQRHQAALRRQDARSENNRQEQEKSKLMDFQIHNPTEHVMLIFWSNDLDKRTEESQYRYIATLPGYGDIGLRLSKRHKFITIPMAEFDDPPTELNITIQIPITMTIFNDQTVKDFLTIFKLSYGEAEPLIIIINVIKDYKPPKIELDKWKETAFKSLFLLTELKRMGASNYDNLAPMIDMIEDIRLPPHTEMDKEVAGVPSTFTNIT